MIRYIYKHRLTEELFISVDWKKNPILCNIYMTYFWDYMSSHSENEEQPSKQLQTAKLFKALRYQHGKGKQSCLLI